VVGLEGVGSRRHCRVAFAGVGAWTVERIGQPDCSPSSFCFALSWTTRLLEVVWRNSTMLGYLSDNLSI